MIFGIVIYIERNIKWIIVLYMKDIYDGFKVV